MWLSEVIPTRCPRAEPRLPRPRRPLHEQIAPVETRRSLRDSPVEPRPRRPPLEDLDQRRVPLLRLRKAQDRVSLHPGRQRLAGNERRRQRLVLQLRASPQRDAAALVVDLDLAEPLGRRVDRPAADLVLLRREAQRVLERLLHRHRLAVQLEPADRLRALDQLLRVEAAVIEVTPPLRLLLAAVVLEQVREQPARLALLRVREQLRLDPRALLEALLRLLLDLALLGRPAPLDLRRSQLEQPPMELVERAAVVLVVGADLLEDRVLPRLEPLLERDDRAAPAGHLLPALEAVERLDLLDRVARQREPQRLADDAEEVDEHLAAQQVVELGLARAVLAHQPL